MPPQCSPGTLPSFSVAPISSTFTPRWHTTHHSIHSQHSNFSIVLCCSAHFHLVSLHLAGLSGWSTWSVGALPSFPTPLLSSTFSPCDADATTNTWLEHWCTARFSLECFSDSALYCSYPSFLPATRRPQHSIHQENWMSSISGSATAHFHVLSPDAGTTTPICGITGTFDSFYVAVLISVFSPCGCQAAATCCVGTLEAMDYSMRTFSRFAASVLASMLLPCLSEPCSPCCLGTPECLGCSTGTLSSPRPGGWMWISFVGI